VETTTLSSKGQLVIPKQVRALANVAAGDAFQVLYLDGEIRLRPIARTKSTTLDEVAGCLANAARKPLSEAQVEADIKARLKTEDAATIRHATKSSKSAT
jgi:AbrB family looped-hinge helix DNA binding protein